MVHIQVWTGSNSIRVIDMDHAYRRGARLSTFHVQAVAPCFDRDDHADVREAARGGQHIRYIAEDLAPDCINGGQVVAWSFPIVRQLFLDEIYVAHTLGAGTQLLSAYDETIRGIDAPRPVLTAGVAGKWSGRVDEHGVHLRQLDDVNEWSEITPHTQTGPRAYDLAKKVWAKVQTAQRLSEAAEILQSAGCKLHGYCALD